MVAKVLWVLRVWLGWCHGGPNGSGGPDFHIWFGGSWVLGLVGHVGLVGPLGLVHWANLLSVVGMVGLGCQV